MKKFYLDIETEPNKKLIDIYMSKVKAPKSYKDEGKIMAYIEAKKEDMVKQMSVDVDLCVVKCIGLKIDDEPAKIVTLSELINIFNEQLKTKAEMAQEFARRRLFEVITFNGKAFDFPILIRECIRQGIKSSVMREMQNWTKKYNSNTSIDLYEILGNGKGKSLDYYSQIYMDWPKKECDFATVSQEELEQHCKDDVEQTAALYKIFEPIFSAPEEDERRN